MTRVYEIKLTLFDWRDYWYDQTQKHCPLCKEPITLEHGKITKCPACAEKMVEYGATVLHVEPNYLMDSPEVFDHIKNLRFSIDTEPQ